MNILEFLDCTDAEVRADWEWHVADNVFNCFLSSLPTKPSPEVWADVWTDGTEILCRTEAIAKRIADGLDAIVGDKFTHYHYYDPEEDERSGEVDDHTGWWYVDFD